MIFGLVYSETVAKFPKAVFAVAAALLVFSLTVVLCVKNPVRVVVEPASYYYYHPGPGRSVAAAAATGKKNKNGRRIERGRSRVSKDLRGGAIQVIGNYGSVIHSSEESGSSS